MPSRPLSITIAAVLLFLESVFNFPLPWESLFPGAEEPPWFIIYPGIVLGIAGLVVCYGLWTLKPWSLWAAIAVGVLNFLLSAPAFGADLPPGLLAIIAAGAIIAVLIVVLVLLPSSKAALRPAAAPGHQT
jgi:hypothetical protein